jgi:hypothetical protein
MLFSNFFLNAKNAESISRFIIIVIGKVNKPYPIGPPFSLIAIIEKGTK